MTLEVLTLLSIYLTFGLTYTILFWSKHPEHMRIWSPLLFAVIGPIMWFVYAVRAKRAHKARDAFLKVFEEVMSKQSSQKDESNGK